MPKTFTSSVTKDVIFLLLPAKFPRRHKEIENLCAFLSERFSSVFLVIFVTLYQNKTNDWRKKVWRDLYQLSCKLYNRHSETGFSTRWTFNRLSILNFQIFIFRKKRNSMRLLDHKWKRQKFQKHESLANLKTSNNLNTLDTLMEPSSAFCFKPTSYCCWLFSVLWLRFNKTVQIFVFNFVY